MTQGTEAAQPETASWRLRLQDGRVFGPATLDLLRAWAMDGRVQPGHQVSADGENWKPAHLLAELEMFWSVEMPDGSMFGPINLKALAESVAEGTLKPSSRIRDLRTGQLTTVAVKMSDIAGAPAEPATGPSGGQDARADMERELAALRARLDSTERQSAAAAAEFAENERAAASRIAALERDLGLARAEAGKSAESARQTADRLQEAGKSAEKQSAAAAAKLAEGERAAASRIAALERDLGLARAEADKSAESARQTADRLQEAGKSAEKQSVAAAARLAENERAAASRIAALERDLSLARAEADKSAESARQAAERLQEAGDSAAAAKAAAEASIASLTARADDLQARLDEAGSELLALLPKDKSETIDWIAGKRTAAHAGKVPHASSVLQKIRQDVERRSAEIRALEARQAELEESLARSESAGKDEAERIALLESEKSSLQGELNAGSARLADLEKALAEARVTAAELEKALAEARAAAAAEADRVNRLREEKKSLAAQNARVVESAQIEIRSLRDNLQKTREAHDTRLAEKDSATERLVTRVKELEDGARAAGAAAEGVAAALRAAQADAQVAAVREKQQRSFLKGMIRELQTALEHARDELAAERDRRMEDMRRAVRLDRELASLRQEGRLAPDQPQPAAAPVSQESRAAVHPLASLELQAERELKVWHSSRKDANPAGKTADQQGLSAKRE